MQALLQHVLPASVGEWLTPPAGFDSLAKVQQVRVDGRSAWHLRYEREDGLNTGLGGEHFSLLIAEEGGLLGSTHFAQDLISAALPDEREAYRHAVAYLEEHASDLIDGLSLQWIEPHGEMFLVDDGHGGKSARTLTGMKVKCRNSKDGRYFWVIVGAQGQVLTFERDVVWDFLRAQRQTEKWLHDSWVVERLTA